MIKVNKLKITKGHTMQPYYTIRFFIFDPKKYFIGTDEAKDICRKEMRCSKKKIKEEYDSIYAVWMKVGRGKNAHIEFNKTTKTAANVIFIVPKKYRRDAYKIINNFTLPTAAINVAKSDS